MAPCSESGLLPVEPEKMEMVFSESGTVKFFTRRIGIIPAKVKKKVSKKGN